MSFVRYSIVAAVAVSFAVPASGGSTFPVDCESKAEELDRLFLDFWGVSREEQWAAHLKEVASAREGERLYAPVPFPKQPAEILRNAKYSYFEMLFDDPNNVPKDELPIYSAIAQDLVSFEFERVDNWGMSRCNGVLPKPYYDLVRVYDRSGKELARFAMHHTGLLGIYAHVTDAARDALPTQEEAADLVADSLRLSARVPPGQYVAVDGVMPHCGDPIIPCVAVRNGGTTYLLSRREALYEIGAGAQRKTITERRDEQVASRSLVPLGDTGSDTRWVTVGFEWVRAERLSPPQR